MSVTDPCRAELARRQAAQKKVGEGPPLPAGSAAVSVELQVAAIELQPRLFG